jgi:hypothetical protein
MKLFHASIFAAFGVAMMVMGPVGLEANARGGLGVQGSPISPRGLHYTVRPHNLLGHHRAARANRNFGQWPFYGGSWPLYGGLYDVPPYGFGNDLTYSTPERVIYVPLPPIALTCKHSESTVTVPAEAGGMREITITRC